VYGHGGIAFAGEPGTALYYLEGCRDFTLTNFACQHVSKGPRPEEWSVIDDLLPGGDRATTPATEWFVLYKRD
jgi:hypothetical protein